MEKINLQIFLLIITSFVIASGCNDGDEWDEIELSNTSCNSRLSTIFIYNNTIGTVTSIPGVNDNPVYINVSNPDTTQETAYVIPCNLPDELKIENLQIRFNGDLKAVAGDFQEPGSEILVVAQPLTLTRLWVIQ